MTETCDLCGRGMARQTLTPVSWPYDHVCRRRGCRAAARDAMRAVVDAREEFDPLIKAVAGRREEFAHPVGMRDDAMAEMDLNGDDWWALDVVTDL